MRCCESPITSTAADPPRVPRAEDVANALLFREILRPLAAELGPVGEIALGNAVDRLFLGTPR